MAKRADRVGFGSGQSGRGSKRVTGQNGSFLNGSIGLRVKRVAGQTGRVKRVWPVLPCLMMISKPFANIQAVGPQGSGMKLILIPVLLNQTSLTRNQYLHTQIKLTHHQYIKLTNPPIRIPIHYRILQIPQRYNIILIFPNLIDLLSPI